MTTLDEILDLDDLEREIAAGYVNRRFHPEFPELALVGYSDRAQFDAHWTPTVRAARGIIYRTDTLEVLARPFAKFFNYGQAETGSLDLDAPILGAWDKLDGSLGIRYTRPDGLQAIATRGSFVSEQAIHATELLRRSADGLRDWSGTGLTWLYEIVYPGNRIVVDYGDRDELVLLGSVHVAHGGYAPPADGRFPFETLREVLAAEPRPNAEGFVAWVDPWTAVKFKQEDYLALHRIVSGLTTKEVWRQLRDGTYAEFAEKLPDEFHEWARETATPLVQQWEAICDRVRAAKAEAQRLYGIAPRGDERKALAAYLKAAYPDVMGYVFSAIDGKDYSAGVWRSIEPKGS